MNDTFDEKAALEEVSRIGTRIDTIVKKIETNDPTRPPDPAQQMTAPNSTDADPNDADNAYDSTANDNTPPPANEA